MSELIGLFNLLAPFFGLIGLGFFCGKVVKQPEAGLAWMQFFIIYVALPCLFYRLIADKPLDQLTNWSFVTATTLATFSAFVLSLTAGWKYTKDLGQSVMQGVAGSYSNVGYMGPPLILAALGEAATPPVILIFVFDTLLLFSLVPLLMSVSGVEKLSLGATIRKIVWRVVTHPFNMAVGSGCPLRALHPRRHGRHAAAPSNPEGGAGSRHHQVDAPSRDRLGSAVGHRGLRRNVDLCGDRYGRPAASVEHFRHLDAVQCRRGASFRMRFDRNRGVDAHPDRAALLHSNQRFAVRSFSLKPSPASGGALRCVEGHPPA
jgi:hypothetical protein